MKIERNRKCTLHLAALIGMLLLVPSSANADIGVPMIFITVPWMIVGLVPIIVIECAVMSKYLSLPYKQCLEASFQGNIISTVIGIPVTWIALVALQMITGGGNAYQLNSPLNKFLAVTWQAPWLITHEAELYWMLPTAALTLSVPFFIASWLIEFKVATRVLKDVDKPRLKAAVRNANLASYGILVLIVLGFLVTAKP